MKKHEILKYLTGEEATPLCIAWIDKKISNELSKELIGLVICKNILKEACGGEFLSFEEACEKAEWAVYQLLEYVLTCKNLGVKYRETCGLEIKNKKLVKAGLA